MENEQLKINLFSILGAPLIETLTADERKAINSISERLSADEGLVKRFSRGYVADCIARAEAQQRAASEYQKMLKQTMQ